MKNFAVNSNNDIYIAGDGNLAISTGLVATAQSVSHITKAQLGEMIYAVNRGIPNFQTIWNGAPNVAQFEIYLRKAILSVEGVVEIQSLVITIQNNVLEYQTEIKTIYGSEVLTSELNF